VDTHQHGTVTDILTPVGLLAGMSWESTEAYYRLINTAVRERVGGLHSAPLLVWSVDFAPVAAMQQVGDWAGAGALLGDAAARLETAGAGAVALCTNTMHLVADAITQRLSVPFISLLDAVAAAATAHGVTRLGLLGTAFTMESDLYPAALAAHGIEVIVPPTDDRALVHRVIYNELCLGVITDSSRAAYQDVIDRLIAAGADAVALACTEIGLLVNTADAAVLLLDTTRMHAAAITDVIINGAGDGSPLHQ
jgi:aspartate racemase